MLCRAELSVALSICYDFLSVREEVAAEYRALEKLQHDDRSNAWMKHYIVRAFESQKMDANATWSNPPQRSDSLDIITRRLPHRVKLISIRAKNTSTKFAMHARSSECVRVFPTPWG